MGWEIVVVAPEGDTWRQPLEGDAVTIGRDEGAQVRLPSPRVSRVHARLSRTADGAWQIEDAGSANGVLVGGRAIAVPTPLTPGLGADIAGYQLTFQVAAEAGSLELVPTGGGAAIPLPPAGGRLWVGREAEPPGHLDDPSLSRRHAEVLVGDDGATVVDAGSSNGTYVDGQRIARAALAIGGEVAFGRVAFRLVARGAALPPGLGPALEGGPAAAALPLADAAPPRTWPWRRLVGAALAVGLVAAVGLVVKPWRLTGHARGLGPGVDEAAFVARRQELLARADEQFQAQLWSSALTTYEAVLAHDPLEPRARLNLAIAEDNRDDAARLAEAHQAMQRDDAALALAAAGKVPAGHFYRPAAEAVAQTAREALGQRARAGASEACRRGLWQTCYAQAAVLLMYSPRSPAGLALADASLDAMVHHRLPFAALGIAGHPAMARTYPDLEVRQAVWRYAAGDVTTAERRLRTFARRPGAPQAASLLGRLRAAQAHGDHLAVGGHLAEGMAAWEEALALDRELTAGGPSVAGGALRQQLATQYLHQGAAAFDRGALPAALAAWQSGLRAAPEHLELPLQLARLEARGRQILESLAERAHLDTAACGHLHEALAFVPATSAVHAQIQEHLKMCPLPQEMPPSTP